MLSIMFTLWAFLKINSHFLFHYYQINTQIKTGTDPGFFVQRSRFSHVIQGGGEVPKIMLVIKYRLVREALVISDSLTNHVL